MKTLSQKDITDLSCWLERQQEFVFLDTSRGTEEDRCSYLFLDPIRWLTCDGPEQVERFFIDVREAVHQGYYLAGWFDYELGYFLEPSLFRLKKRWRRPVAVAGVFDSPVIFEHSKDNGEVIAGLTGCRSFPEQEYSVHGLRPNIDRQEYRQAIGRIKEFLVAGDTYQVNYTFKLLFGLEGSKASFYQALRRNQSVSYGAWIRWHGRDIMSFSPELFFRADREKVTVKPMKGTMSRGKTVEEDLPRRKALREDEKNVSENVMIVDLLRNDLGCLLHSSGGGTVRPRCLFDVEAYETVLQMTSTIDGLRSVRRDPDVLEAFNALFPCGSVTGAPKIRTMEIIHDLEKEPRGVYCGAIGFCCGREAVFNVPIRTVLLEDGKGEMGVGSGIVYDSVADAEWDECLLKGEFLAHPRPDFQLIETFLWRPESGYRLFREHMDRLEASASYFFFRYDRQEITGLLEETARKYANPMRVRLLLCRDGSVEISAAEIGENINQGPQQPVPGQGAAPMVRFSAIRTDPENIHLYHKTTARELYDAERKRALSDGYYEVLFVNKRGEVTEGSVTNIFVLEKDGLVTPGVKSGLLPGTFRRSLLEKGEAAEKVLKINDILEAEKVYVGNSVRGLIEVQVNDRIPVRKGM